MPESLLFQRVDAIRRLARRGAQAPLAKVVAKTRPADLAAALEHLAPAEQRLVFAQITEDSVAAEVLTRIGKSELHALLHDLPNERLIALFQELAAEDQTDVLEHLPEEKRQIVLERIKVDERAEIEELLGYAPDTAGGIMAPLAFRLRDDTTCRDAVAAVQAAIDHELVYYVYVENEAGQLAGVTSLRTLLTHPPSTRLADIMITDLIVVTTMTDQEEVARVAGRYDLLAVPVVDDGRRLVGIVTVDDVIDVIREEAAEDMLLMAGVGREEADPSRGPRVAAARKRLPWLLATAAAGLIVAEILHAALGPAVGVAWAARLIPLVIGVEGSAGTQSATLAVRNIATGRMEGAVRRILVGEGVTGALLGFVLATVVGAYTLLRDGVPVLAIGVAGGTFLGMLAATLVGTLVPVTFKRVGVDPAVATGPFVTATMDLVGVVLFLGVVAITLGAS